jgi:ubiquinone/menaquinone biosynthesis C-methylase UbiE
MKYINLMIFLLALMVVVSLQAQNMSIFLRATQSGWYPEFLKPVVETIMINPDYRKILDIGTGPGTLPQLLITKDSSLQITGIDVDTAMIDEARKRLTHKNVLYQYEQVNAALAFDDNQFDVITFCSVLFLVDDSVKTSLMNEALRLLKPKGSIIILTPSGAKSRLSSFLEVWRYPFSHNNFTFMIWKTVTTGGGRKWKKEKWLARYASENKLHYTSSLTFNGNAAIETISK